MIYHVRHQTIYHYKKAAVLCHNEARLRPLDLPSQRCLEYRLNVEPHPDFETQRRDSFGNHVDYFAVQRPHETLVITAETRVEILTGQQISPTSDQPWDRVGTALQSGNDEQYLNAREFTLPSPMIPRLPELLDFAAPDFPAGRPLIEAVTALNRRIFETFSFKPGFTTVSTPVAEVLANRAGVCQDFAQLMIGAIRSLGLPARYVSGYLETRPPAGKPKLIGADASHAWVSVFLPGSGWIDFDPTNNVLTGSKHITTAVGRDYGDVAPLRGVTTGGSTQHLEVAVDVNEV